MQLRCFALGASIAMLGGLGCSAASADAAGGRGDAGSGGAGQNGAGGSSQAGSNAGASPASGGSSAGSGVANGGGSSAAGSGGSSSGSGGGSQEPGACPADAFFCTGFEDAGIPAGASFQPAYKAADWAAQLEFQSAVKSSGAQALELPSSSEYWRMLSWPLPASTFWARVYVRSSVELGQNDHNAFLMAMTGDGDQNGGDNVEVAEQYCQVVLNLHDDVVVTSGGTPACNTGKPPLAKDTWHCMEAFFDGPNGAVQIYADGGELIDKTGWTKLSFATFSLGFVKFHGPERDMFYDDLAVGPTRIGCP
jgi:hypothetical protein